ncbi:MAG TPA: zinc-ribbon domain-containing protein [Terriglobales bacterium]|nr:zinc-ribbon domain-containing protein [Terriglobales bacterium]
MSVAADFSNPELNPLINPLLGRNLARWAQVYLTTPPEQREAAITDLLRQLQAEARNGTSGALNSGSMFSTPSPPPVCPKCGHQSLPDAKFCGLCGASLMDAEAFLVDSSRRQGAGNVGDTSAPTAFSFAPSEPPFTPPQPAPSPVAAPELPSFAPAPEPPSHSNLDVTWLRERNLFGADDEPRSYTKYVFLLLVVLCAAGAFLYFRTATAARNHASPIASAPATPGPAQPTPSPGTERPSPPESSAPSIPQVAAPTSPAANSPLAPATAANAVPASPSPAAQAHKANGPSVHSAALATSGVTTATQTPAATASIQDDGSVELAVAEDYLEGRKGPRNSTAAAQLLWRAVAKQNNTAILLLSDLYVNGDGVPQSCDQARILLSAADRRNVKAAADRLRSLAGSCR